MVGLCAPAALDQRPDRAIGGNGPRPELVIRVGTPSDFIASLLPGTLAQFRERWPDVRFIVRTDFYEPLTRQFTAANIDLLHRPVDDAAA